MPLQKYKWDINFFLYGKKDAEKQEFIYHSHNPLRKTFERSSPDNPNIILISLDTLRAQSMGCYGFEKETTPFLDQIAQEGALFENMCAASTSTPPSHMSMMTGLYLSVHGVLNRQVLNPKIRTLAEIYQELTSLSMPSSWEKANVGGGKLQVYAVAPTNMKYFKDVENVVTMESFKTGANKVFRRVCTLYLLQEQDNKYKNIISLIKKTDVKFWKDIYEPIADLMEEAKKYFEINNWNSHGIGYRHQNFVRDACLPIAKENNWFDHDFLNKLDTLQNYFEGLDLIYHLANSRDFPTLAVAKYIRNHNKASRSVKKDFKRLNSYYYVMFNEHEMEMLKDNTEEYKFVKQRQDVKLKKVS